MSNNTVPITYIGGKEDLFPMAENIWDFFSHKGTKTVFLSIGSSSTPLVELQFSEMLGCSLHIFDSSETHLKQWEETKEVLSTRKTTDTHSEFAKLASKKWVLARNVHLHPYLPFFFDGSVTIKETTYTTKDAENAVKEICKGLGFSESEAHVDVLKIQMKDKEHVVLNAVLDAGFRPAFVLIHWSALPDTNIASMNAAGNLQMLGYALVGKHEHNFLYYFNNNNYYETCSWELINKSGENTLVNEIVKSVLPSTPTKKEASS